MRKKQIRKKQIILSLFAILLLVSLPTLYILRGYLGRISKKSEPTVTVEAVSEVPKKTPPKTVVEIPASSLLVVPYTVQAPYANWKVHEESCEEAAVLMYHKYLEGIAGDIDPATADREIRAMKSWQVKNYGSEPDLPITRLGVFVGSYYGYQYRIIPNLNIEGIKKEVAAGHPVLVPVLTQSLKNPHYSPGNVYHILLIKGYDATGVITNDAGVKEGKDWHYSWEILFSAIDASNAKIGQGRVGLVMTKS